MKRLLPVLLALAASSLPVAAQSVPSPGEMSHATPPPPPADATPSKPETKPAPATTTKGGRSADSQAIIDRLTRTNADLLDLLKKQQSVLEDIQYDRRLQNRQINLTEQRLEDTLQQNADLEAKVANLQATAAAAPAAPAAPDANSPASAQVTPPKLDEPAASAAPPEPSSHLPPEQTTGAPGTMWWHRVLTISGDDSKSSDPFHVTGKQWRVLWHNQDKPGDAYKGTSGLFINAFPVKDTVPKKVCSQLGNGSDEKDLTGSGDYYLKVDSAGGHWEAAVEEMR